MVDVELTGSRFRGKAGFHLPVKDRCALRASMMIGFHSRRRASEKEQKRVEEIASAVGLAFQIQDDILDVTRYPTEELGKPVLSDEKNQKTTYVTLVGDWIRQKADVAEISADVVSLLKELPGENRFLENLITKLVERKNREKLRELQNHDSGTQKVRGT